MQALVLVGGQGTRLRPLTLTQPKPAVPLVDRPFIRFMADWLGRHGVSDVVMACGFRPEDLRSALGDEIPGGPRVRYIEESEPLGTAGPIRLAADQGLLTDRFLVLNGDVLTDLDLTEHMRVHSERDAVASLALYPVDDPTSYGLVRKDRQTGAVTEFLEKPDPAEIDTDEVNAGAYVLERSVVDLIPAGRSVSIEREIFPRLVGQGLFGLRLDGYWMDIGTPDRYLQASWDILTGRVETEVGERVSDGVGVDEHADVDRSAHVEAPVLVDSGASVAAGAHLGPKAVIGRDCEVGEGAVVVGSVIHAELLRRGRRARRGSDPGRGGQGWRECGGRGRLDRRRGRPNRARRAVRARRTRRTWHGCCVSGDCSMPSARSIRRTSSMTCWRCPTISPTRSSGSSRRASRPTKSNGLVVCGMGGSAIGGDLARARSGAAQRFPSRRFAITGSSPGPRPSASCSARATRGTPRRRSPRSRPRRPLAPSAW